MKHELFYLLLFPALLQAQPVKQRNLFTTEFVKCNFPQTLIPAGKWIPYPGINSREFWKNIPEKKKQYFLTEAEKSIGKDWVFLPAMVYFEYTMNGNRSNYESLVWTRQAQLQNLVMAELIENKGRFLPDIVNGIWSFCEESSWCWPAHIAMQKAGVNLPDVTEPIPDLGVGEKSAKLAWASYLLKDKLDSISPLICKRIYFEVEKRLLLPVLQRNDCHWMGYTTKRPNNWNPWITSNYLACVFLLENDKSKQTAYVKKAMELLDLFTNAYPDDGGCDEGPAYWDRAAGSMFDCLDLLSSATNKAFDIYSEPLIKNMGSYLPSMHIADNWFVNFADASSKINYSKDAALLYALGEETGSKELQQLAAFFSSEEDFRNADLRFIFGTRLMREIFIGNKINTYRPNLPPYLRDSWFPGIGVMTARTKAGSAEGLYLAAQGGHNDESHNHNDVGNFVVYDDGNPLLIDIGVETYSRKTFSAERYSIWTMQSQYHNCPLINGVMQSHGMEFKAENVNYSSTDTSVIFSLDISKAYPDSAFVSSWIRTFNFTRGKSITISDQYALTKSVQPAQWFFMSLPKPVIVKPGVIGFENSKRTLTYNSKLFTLKIEPIAITDGQLNKAWGDTLYRILLIRTSKTKSETCFFVIN